MMSQAPPLETTASISARTGINRRTLNRWQKSGTDIRDPHALAARIAIMPLKMDVDASQAPAACDDAETYQDARRRREIANANRAETIAARERGELIEAARIQHDGDAIGRTVRRELEKLTNDMPPQLAGRNASEISTILRREVRAMLTRFSEYHDEIFTHQEP